MKFALASDLHHEFYSVPPALTPVDADVLILAGDIETIKSHNNDWWDETCRHYKYVIYIRGNHEYYKAYYNDYPTFYYPDNVIAVRSPAQFIELDGVRILAGTMWTDLSNPLYANLAKVRMNDYRLIKYSRERYWFTPEDTTREFRAFKAELEFQKPNVVISHHLPSYGSVNERYIRDDLNCAYATEMDVQGVKLWVHGHTHIPVDYVKDGCRIVCNPKGYPGESIGPVYKPKVIKYSV